VKAFLLLACYATLAAQDHPQFVWQGQVDGTAILRLAGKHLSVKTQGGSPVEREKFHFSDALPESQQNARLEVRQGRGYVHVLEQPAIDNHYTLAVAIEDRQPGSSFYSLALYWDTSNNPFEKAEKTDRLSWAGRVEEAAVISCHERTCVASAEPGAAPTAGASDARFKFSRALPDRDVEVRLEDPDGRGEIRVTEQPSQRNHYTARVAIHDPLPGSGEYSFVLVWNRANSKAGKQPKDAEQSVQAFEPVGRGFLWSGAVNGRVRVTLEGGASFSQVVQGAPVQGEHADILRPLPERADLMPKVQKLSGRGRVSIIQSPSEQNHYRLIFEIDDPGPGTGDYTVEVDW